MMLTIILALGHNLSSSSQGSLIFVFFESLVIVDDTLDKRLFEICNFSCQSCELGSRRLPTYPHE